MTSGVPLKRHDDSSSNPDPVPVSETSSEPTPAEAFHTQPVESGGRGQAKRVSMESDVGSTYSSSLLPQPAHGRRIVHGTSTPKGGKGGKGGGKGCGGKGYGGKEYLQANPPEVDDRHVHGSASWSFLQYLALQYHLELGTPANDCRGHYHLGKCLYPGACKFDHLETKRAKGGKALLPVKRLPCRFYQQGACRKEGTCQFAHNCGEGHLNRHYHQYQAMAQQYPAQLYGSHCGAVGGGQLRFPVGCGDASLTGSAPPFPSFVDSSLVALISQVTVNDLEVSAPAKYED